MGVLRDTDRPLLVRACELASGVRRPPRKLGNRVEPVWSAVLASGEKELASAVFLPGDTDDAVKRLLETYQPVDHSQEDVTLFLTLEPKAGFDRLPPVTESIRRLGVKRVVVGALDPAQRYRGEGSGTLERMGIEVVLADGEEARLAQQLLEDYSKFLSRGLSVVRARVQLQTVPDGIFDLKLAEEANPAALVADAILCVAGKKVDTKDAWRVILDPENWERPADRTILYQSAESALPGARTLAFKDGKPDLGALLRDLASLGIMSVELCGDATLFRQALEAGLIDSVLAQFPESGDGVWALPHVDRVRLNEGGEILELKLGGARLLDSQKNSLEAQISKS